MSRTDEQPKTCTGCLCFDSTRGYCSMYEQEVPFSGERPSWCDWQSGIDEEVA